MLNNPKKVEVWVSDGEFYCRATMNHEGGVCNCCDPFVIESPGVKVSEYYVNDEGKLVENAK